MTAGMSADWTEAYFGSLHAGRESPCEVEHRLHTYRDGSHPESNQCHHNAARFVAENPGCRVVQGWLCNGVGPSHTLFHAHSIVADENDHLIDITPMSSELLLSFLLHKGTEEQFIALCKTCSQIYWPISPDYGLHAPPDDDEEAVCTF